MSRDQRPESLYRKVNTRARGVHHHTGGDYRHERNSKRERSNAADEVSRGSMHGHTRRGRDYTPLFRFLLSKVGEDWAGVLQEAQRRLDAEAPIYWIGRPQRTRTATVHLHRREHVFQRALCRRRGSPRQGRARLAQRGSVAELRMLHAYLQRRGVRAQIRAAGVRASINIHQPLHGCRRDCYGHARVATLQRARIDDAPLA